MTMDRFRDRGRRGLPARLDWQLNSLARPVLTVAPALSGTPNPGQTITVAAGSWTDAASVQRDLMDGATVVAAGIADGYTHVAAHGESLRVHEVATHTEGGTATANSNVIGIVYAAPAAAGSVADQTFTEGTGEQVVPTAGDFTTADPAPVYSLVLGGAGISINSATGDVSVFTGGTGVISGQSIVVRITDADGQTADTGFSLTVQAATGATTLSLDALPFDGIRLDTGGALGANMQHRVRNNASRTVVTDKVWGVDAAPAGVSVVNSAVTVDSDTFVGAFTGWKIDGLTLHITGNWSTLTAVDNVQINVSDADLPLVAPQTHYVFVDLPAPATVLITDIEVNGPNTYTNPSDAAGYAAPANAFRIGGPGSGSGYADTGSIIRRLRCKGVVADGVKFYGKESVVEDCALIWTANTPEGTAIYDQAQTYDTGAFVLNDSGHLFRALVDGITGAGGTPPATKVDDANWAILDPHMDGISVYASLGGNILSRNFIYMKPAEGRVLVGANNGIRAVADNSANPMLSDVYQNNVIDRDRTVSSRSIQQSDNGSANAAPSAFLDNWLSAHSGGQILYPPSSTFTPVWVGNRNLDTGAVQNDHPADVVVDRMSAFNQAHVPVSGVTDAADGAVIEARVLRASDSAEIHSWADVGAVTGGAFSGSVGAEIHADKLIVEARVKSVPAVGDTFANGFHPGHVIAQIQQSEDARMYADAFNNTVPETILDETNLLVVTADEAVNASVSNRVQITNATPHTAAMAALSNELNAIAPGEKWMVIDLAHSGTNRADLVEDADIDRSWADMVTTLNLAGTHPGLVIDTWTAADGAAGDKFRGAFFPVYSKLQEDGTPFVLGSTHAFSTFTPFVIDHCLWDLADGTEGQFDAARTKLMFYGPHRFDPSQDLINATTSIDTSTYDVADKKEKVRADIRAMVDDPLLAEITTHLGPEINAYQNGKDQGGWSDSSHPSDVDPDGLELRAKYTAHTILSGLGRSPHIPPQFNRRFEEPSGAYVEFWYEAPDGSTPPITTTRLARAEAALPATYAHWTEVVGFEINGVPAENVTIVSGRVRVLPNSGAFSVVENNTITFGKGGATGSVKYPEDMENGLWKNWPGIAPSSGTVDIISLRPMPDPSVLSLTRVPVIAGTFTNITDAHFEAPADTGTADTSITGRINAASIAQPASQACLIELDGFKFFGIYVNSDGSLNINQRDGDGTYDYNDVSTAAGVITFGVAQDIVFCSDFANNSFQLWVNGALAVDLVGTPDSATSASNRHFAVLAETDATQVLTGSWYDIKIWLSDATTDGTEPAGTPYKAISGTDLAAVNADAWKAGTEAFS